MTATSCDNPDVLVYTLHRAGSNFVAEVLADICLSLRVSLQSSNDPQLFPQLQDARWRGIIAEHRGCFGPIRVGEANPCVPFDLAPYEVVVHIRDPRDVLVSLYYAMLHVVPRIEGGGGWSESERVHWMEAGIDAYARFACPAIARRYRFIQECIIPSAPRVLRYEDMVTDFTGWLDGLLPAFRLPPSEQRKLHRRLCDERDGAFAVDAENATAHKRQVRPGDHRRKLTTSTISHINRQMDDVLSAFSYR